MASCLVVEKCSRKAILRISAAYAYLHMYMFMHVYIMHVYKTVTTVHPGFSAYDEEITDLCVK